MADIKSERLQLEALENLFKQKRFSEALNFTKKLTRDYPHSFPIKLIHVRTLKELNRLGEGVEALEDMMQVFPNNINLLMEGGILALKRNKFDESLEYYNRILFLDPFNTEAKESIDRINTIRKSGGSSGTGPKKMDFVTYQSEQFNRSDTLHEFDTTEVEKVTDEKIVSSTETQMTETQMNTTSNPPEPIADVPEPMEALDIFGKFGPETSPPPPLLFDDLGGDEDLTELPPPPDASPEWDQEQEEIVANEEEPIPADTPETFGFPEMDDSISPPVLDFGDFENESLQQTPALDPVLGWDLPEDSPGEDTDSLTMPDDPEFTVQTDQTEEPEELEESEESEFLSMPEDTDDVNITEEVEMLSSQEELEKESGEPEIPESQLAMMPPPVFDFADLEDAGDSNNIEETVPALIEEDSIPGWEQELMEKSTEEPLSGSVVDEGEDFNVSQFYTAVPDKAEFEPIGLVEPVMEENQDEFPEDFQEEVQDEFQEEVQEEVIEEFQEELLEDIQDEIPDDMQEGVEEDAQIITESAAELYLKQGLLEDAAMIYAKLYNTRKEERFLVKMNQLRRIRANRKKIDVLSEFLRVIQSHR